MAVIEIEQFEDSRKILRFLDKDGLMKTLGIEQRKIPRHSVDIDPSFLLRSLRYYRLLENDRGDQYENEIITMHPEMNIPLSDLNLNPIFVSCWSCYQSSDLDDLEAGTVWSVFSDTAAVIESTVKDVNQIISWLAPTPKNEVVPQEGNWGSLRASSTQHGKIIYYSPCEYNAIYGMHSAIPMNCFFKRQELFSNENEYRFIVLFNNHLHFSPESFSVRLEETNYIKKIYLKENLFSKEELSIIDGSYGHKIKFINNS